MTKIWIKNEEDPAASIGDLKIEDGLVWGYIKTPLGETWVVIGVRPEDVCVYNYFDHNIGYVSDFKLSMLFLHEINGRVFVKSAAILGE